MFGIKEVGNFKTINETPKKEHLRLRETEERIRRERLRTIEVPNMEHLNQARWW